MNDVEVAWHKATASGYNGNCVEVAGLSGDYISVRDSKDPDGPMLTFGRAEWESFTAGVKSGEFDVTPL